MQSELSVYKASRTLLHTVQFSWQGLAISYGLIFKLHLSKGCKWQSNSCLGKILLY